MITKRALLLLALLALSNRVVADGPVKVNVVREDGVATVVEFRAGTELVTRYHLGPAVAKPYFWPLHATGEVAVTRAWPMKKGEAGETTDHVHQKSVWFCHGDVIPEGIELKRKVKGVDGVDFWSENANAGKIVCTQVAEPVVEGGVARVKTRNEWRSPDGVKILSEERTVGLHLLGSARLLVLDIDLHADACPVTFGDTKEGAMGIRIHDLIKEVKGAGKMENAEGKTGEKALWGHPSVWCDYSGPLGGKVVGLAILCDPANPVPSCWHSRGYGLMAANPFGRGKSGFPAMQGRSDLVKLAKGDHLKLRFGVLVHHGDTKEGKVAEHHERFVKLK